MAQSCPSFFYRKYFPKYFFLSHKITFITDFYLGLINIFIKLKVVEKLYFLFFSFSFGGWWWGFATQLTASQFPDQGTFLYKIYTEVSGWFLEKLFRPNGNCFFNSEF